MFRSTDVREEENTMLFVTKCPCDECVPLIQGAGIKQIYTTDLDSGRDKNDISYISFIRLKGIRKFIVRLLRFPQENICIEFLCLKAEGFNCNVA